jgi:hypothetical protein
MSGEENNKKNNRSGTITGALILIFLGVAFLLINFGVLPDWGDSWPIFIIVIGLALIIGTFAKGKSPERH